jgi:competence protein ComEC
VLKAPHHGGNTSSSQSFLEALALQVAIITVGAENRCGHPSAQVLEHYAALGIPVLRTDELGTLEFVTNGERLWVRTDR